MGTTGQASGFTSNGNNGRDGAVLVASGRSRDQCPPLVRQMRQ
jgi:hypothetical protein